jgi:hypothetical protein
VGPGGESLLDYGLFDAHKAGFTRFVFVIREELESTFREWGRQRWPHSLEVAYAHQELDDLPPGWAVPQGREKPWGTGHALLSARHHLTGPFGVINADDFYGASSYRLLLDHLTSVDRNREETSPVPEWGLVGYRLEDTLSEHGGVSRGICRVGEDGLLEGIEEVHQIHRAPNDDGDDPPPPPDGLGAPADEGAGKGALLGVTEARERVHLTGKEIISRNLWGFTAGSLRFLEDLFLAFLEERGTDPDAEFLIPGAVAILLSRGDASVRVMPATELSFGMTHPQDLEGVRERLAALATRGVYPTPLFTPAAP